MTEVLDIKRLRWAIRRGMLELDLIFAPYVESRYEMANVDEQQLFCELLACNDQELYDWLLHKEPPKNPKFKPIIAILLSHARL